MIETGSVSSFDEFLPICEKISKSGNYRFCPGIDVNVFLMKHILLFFNMNQRVFELRVNPSAESIRLNVTCGIDWQKMRASLRRTWMM